MSMSGSMPVELDADMKNTIIELAGLYRFGPSNPWQLIAGLRQYKLEVTVTDLPGPEPTLSVKETFNDFFVGGRYIESISDKWTFTTRADIGTGDSDLVWNALVAFDYRFSNLLSDLVGWRVLDYDVDQGSGADRLVYDMNHSGSGLALTFHW